MVISGVIGFTGTFCLIPVILRLSQKAELNRGSSEFHHAHAREVPRFGGASLAAAFIAICVFVSIVGDITAAEHNYWDIILVTSLAMFVLGFWDDLRALGAKRKLFGQIIIASVAYFAGLQIETLKIPGTAHIINLGAGGYFVTVLWLVGMTNLINLIDGVDGLAGGISLMLMVLLAFVTPPSSYLSFVAAGMVGALSGFLRYNFPPAKIYMGDGGAYFLGFLIGANTIVSSQKGTILAALAAPLFVLALPILDTSIAIVRRGLHGLPLFRADRDHIHHRLIKSGLSRRQVVVGMYAVTLMFLGFAFASYWSEGRWMPTMLGVGALVVLLIAAKFKFSREWFNVARTLGGSFAMRQEVQFTLAQTKWLCMEAQRGCSAESLWNDLVFIANKLGFSEVKLRLPHGERVWRKGDSCLALHASKHALAGGRLGTLELKVCHCHSKRDGTEKNSNLTDSDRAPTVNNERLFTIISDLVAEGWLKAATVWEDRQQMRLRFDSERDREMHTVPQHPVTAKRSVPISES